MKTLYYISIIGILINFKVVFAQLDSIHYLPPLKQVTNLQAIKDQRFYLSSPETSPFSVNIYLGTSLTPLTTISNISKGSPEFYNPGNGDNNISLVSNQNTGVVLSNSGLRFESQGGELFYVNYRGRNSSQAGSLTSKGQSALGTDFRWGGIPNRGNSNKLSSSLGIMATQDNTLILISGYDPDCVFRFENDSDGITSNTITKNLNKGQTFVLEAVSLESSANVAGWIGASIVSNNPIAISSGGLNLGVVSGQSSRDVGIDQIVPTNLLGKEYAFIRAKGGDNVEFVNIVAYQDDTEVFVGGTSLGTINDGEYLEIPGSYYSTSSVGGNMFVNTSKEAYAFQCMAGQQHIKTLGMNFVAPLNCLLPNNLNEIPLIDEIAGASSGESAVTIIASTLTPDSQIILTDDTGNITLPVGSPILGTTEWKTFGVSDLVGQVNVSSTGPMAVGVFMRYGANAGLAGYFSGFDTAPDVDIQLSNSHCIPGISITTGIEVYDAYQWYFNGTSISGETTGTISPMQDGNYYVEVTKGFCSFSSNNLNLISCPLSIDFDGVNDYIHTGTLINNTNGISSMAWVNLNATFSSKGYLLGEDSFNIFINDDKTIGASITTDQGVFNSSRTQSINAGEWVHITSVFNGSSLKIYVNGEESSSNSIQGNLLLNSTDFFIGKNPAGNLEYLKGFIQEVKVYSLALTETQIQEQVFQRIVSNNGAIKGEITKHDIEGLNWNDLQLYLKLTEIQNGFTPDESQNNEINALYNITTSQQTNAPLPYIANASGQWTEESTWENGNVWDVEDLPNKDWAIVKVTNSSKVTSTDSHTHLGLLIENGSELEIDDDQLLKNTKYVKLEGQIDLVGESQFIQTSSSNLDVLSTGFLERDQDGKSSLYNYNHWSSPVGSININSNNSSYSVAEVLRDGTNSLIPKSINFITNSYNGSPSDPITLADYWIFTFNNFTNDYNNWNQVRSSGLIKVGEGYTMKGSGSSLSSQNYVFVGKPNNGIIQHSINSNNLYLLGNPYPSALDADKFINDNPSFTGALYFWEHWGGTSHVLSEYEGGYATYNLAGGVKAISNSDVSSNGTGAIRPGRYVAVAQGFFVEGSSSGGIIEFNNDQREFKKESVASDDTIFLRNDKERLNQSNLNSNEIEKFYFRFITPEGPERELLLAVKEGLNEDFNYGYDAKLMENQYSDCSWLLNTENETKLVIQGIGALHNDLELPLQINVGAEGVCKFELASFTSIEMEYDIFFLDKELNSSTILEQGIQIEFSLSAATYKNRFFIAFKPKQVLTTQEIETFENEFLVFYDSLNNQISISNSTNFSTNNVKLYNILM